MDEMTTPLPASTSKAQAIAMYESMEKINQDNKEIREAAIQHYVMEMEGVQAEVRRSGIENVDKELLEGLIRAVNAVREANILLEKLDAKWLNDYKDSVVSRFCD